MIVTRISGGIVVLTAGQAHVCLCCNVVCNPYMVGFVRCAADDTSDSPKLARSRHLARSTTALNSMQLSAAPSGGDLLDSKGDLDISHVLSPLSSTHLALMCLLIHY